MSPCNVLSATNIYADRQPAHEADGLHGHTMVLFLKIKT